MLLATALHRWWPDKDHKPIVADMSYYTLLSDSDSLPKLHLKGNVIIVQDILDKGTISNKLLELITNKGVEVVCIIGLIRLVVIANKHGSSITPLNEGWDSFQREGALKQVPAHAMINVLSPPKSPPLTESESDKNSFWIEPRALYPIRYTSLRREFAPGHDTDLDRRNKVLPIFDSPSTGCLFASGHYVYGNRHYAAAIDVRKTLNGNVGKEIAHWLADICLGNQNRHKASWERENSKDFVGDVTAVLMPLHSQIHYLWPRIANILAQCGRRQPVWLLDATLFTGSGAAYRLPTQFINLIESAVQHSIASLHQSDGKNKTGPIRLLILDDAITTARTAETILGAITRKYNEIFDRYLREYPDAKVKHGYPKPIEWIRYFAVFSQLGYARYLLWQNIKHLDGIPFALEEYAPFMGVSVFDEKNCPICRNRRRLRRLIPKCDQFGAIHTITWAKNYLKETTPVAIDSPWREGKKPKRIKVGVKILNVNTKQANSQNIVFNYAETAVWRFHEYMYLSYPIGDFLIQINKSWAVKNQRSSSFPELYRWTVLEWCLQNWTSVEAATAEENFLSCVNQELGGNTDLIEKILVAATQHYSNAIIKTFVINCIDKFAESEKRYQQNIRDIEAISYIERLEIGLTSFFLHIPKHALDETYSPKNETEFLDNIHDKSIALKKNGLSFINNLYTRLKRPRRLASPRWALNVIAESLLRGRNPTNAEKGGHHLLPRLLGRVSTSFRHGEWFLLQGSVSVFLAALEDLAPYTVLDPSFDDENGGNYHETVKRRCIEILNWYKKYSTYEEAKSNPVPALTKLDDLLQFNGSFIKKIHNVFHVEMSFYKKFIEQRIQEDLLNSDLLTFDFKMIGDVVDSRCLAPVGRLSICLANLAVDPIENYKENHKSQIVCYEESIGEDPVKIVFKILTNFEKPTSTSSKLTTSVHAGGERSILSQFGVVFDKIWRTPNSKEIDDGYTAIFKITVPSGYVPRRANQ